MADIFLIRLRLKTTLWLLGGVLALMLFGAVYFYRNDYRQDYNYLGWAVGFASVLMAWLVVLVIYLFSRKIFTVRPYKERSRLSKIFSIQNILTFLLVCFVIIGTLVVRKAAEDPTDAFGFLSENDIPSLEQFLENNPEKLFEKNESGRSLLFQAVVGNNLLAVETLLAAGADALEADNPEDSPLLLSLAKSDLFPVLLKSVGQIEPNDPQFKNLLLKAVKNDMAGHVHSILEQGVTPDVFDESLSSALICATKQKSHTIMKDLLIHGCLVDIFDAEGYTAIHHAARLDDVVALEMLASAGTRPTAIAHNGYSALHTAVLANSTNAALCLLQSLKLNPDLRDKTSFTALHLAAMTNRKEMAKLLLAYGADVNIVDSSKTSPLKMAMMHKFEEMEKLLRDAGANDGFVDEQMQKDFIYAVGHNQPQRVQALLKAGVDVNVQDRNGISPLHMASYHGFHDIAKMLLLAGADTTLKDVKGNTPITFLKEQRLTDLLLLIDELKNKTEPESVLQDPSE